ncbi:MAG: MoxR family ATPase [Planctomycetota bacterium]|nr:MoxR family ATPase [Planctomycetota bacterium]
MTDSKNTATADLAELELLRGAMDAIRERIATVVVGQEEVVESLLIAILSGGHCMLEGVPGLAKTLLVQTLSETLSLSFARIQFTPDLMPSDITGTEVMQEDRATGERAFRFINGPIFNNIVLADEINRTPPKTQAALLEGMQERQVSVSGERHALPRPFFVLATQNPIEQEGTYPLPEAQLDRFLLKILLGYPGRDVEREVYRRYTMAPPPPPEAVLGGEELLAMQDLVRRIPMNDLVVEYALSLVRSTRRAEAEAPDFIKDWLMIGAGPRGGLAMLTAAKARAAMHGRPEATIEDVQAVARPALRHRMILSYSAEAEGQTADSVIDRLLAAVPVHATPGELGERVGQVLGS